MENKRGGKGLFLCRNDSGRTRGEVRYLRGEGEERKKGGACSWGSDIVKREEEGFLEGFHRNVFKRREKGNNNGQSCISSKRGRWRGGGVHF